MTNTETFVAQAARLQALAAETLSDDSLSDIAMFMDRVERYLSEFDTWRAGFKDGPEGLSELGASDSETEEIRKQLTELDSIHQELLAAAKLRMETVASQFGVVNQRSEALKAYIGKLPERITLTGRRQG